MLFQVELHFAFYLDKEREDLAFRSKIGAFYCVRIDHSTFPKNSNSPTSLSTHAISLISHIHNFFIKITLSEIKIQAIQRH